MDVSLHYEERGIGMPLILLHGNGEDLTYFKHQIEHFSKSRRVIAVDTRGHGKSPRGTAPFTLAQFAEDLLRFLDERKLEKADILGFSDGGNIALLFALTHPERVGKLIVNGANLSPKGVKAWVQIPVVIGYRIASFFARRQESARSNAEMLGLMVNEPHIEPVELQKLTMPVLVIAGSNDMIKERHTRLIAASIPGSELAIIKGDHFIAHKENEAFNAVVEKFLENRA